MADEQSQLWSRVAHRYDRVVDLQIGPNTRSLVRERLAREGRLGRVVELGCGTGFYTQVLADKADGELCDLLGQPGFEVVSTETIRDASRSSNIPIEYVRAVKA